MTIVKRDGLKKVFILSTGQKVIAFVQYCKREHPKKAAPFRTLKRGHPTLSTIAIETKEIL
jgi:hypothetical protein